MELERSLAEEAGGLPQGWGEGRRERQAEPSQEPSMRGSWASLMLHTLSQLRGGNCIATRAPLSQEGSAKGIMSLILLSTWLQWVFSLLWVCCCFFFQGPPGSMGQPGLAGEPGMKVRKPLSAISLSDQGDNNNFCCCRTG